MNNETMKLVMKEYEKKLIELMGKEDSKNGIFSRNTKYARR